MTEKYYKILDELLSKYQMKKRDRQSLFSRHDQRQTMQQFWCTDWVVSVSFE